MAQNVDFFYKKLLASEVAALGEFNKELHGAIVEPDELARGQSLNNSNYACDLLAALRSGMKWASLTRGDVAVLEESCHPTRLAPYRANE
jgi:hypothetical protein